MSEQLVTAGPSQVLTGDQWEQSQYLPGSTLATTSFDEGDGPGTKKKPAPKPPAPLDRLLTGDEWEHAQTLPGPTVKSLRLPALPPMARDATATPLDRIKAPKGTPLAPFDIKDPSTYANPVLRQLINPALENPFTTAATVGAAGVPIVGPAIMAAMGTDISFNIARYGYQKYLELDLSPEARKEFEKDPDLISGEAAAMQAAMLGLAPLVHVSVKAARSLDYGAGMVEAGAAGVKDLHLGPEFSDQFTDRVRTSRFATALENGAATARVPQSLDQPKGIELTGAMQPPTRQPRPVKGLESSDTAVGGKTKPLATESPADALTALTEARRADAERVAAAEAMRPRRRVKEPVTFFESEQGAEVLGMQAGRHGLPNDASPYPPETAKDIAWKSGHAAATESFPEGFTMGGALTDNRIPSDYTPPRVPAGDIPEGATPETVALANALKPSRFRAHSTDALAEAALDTQTAIEQAQQAVTHAQSGRLMSEAGQADLENRGVSYSDSFEGSSVTAERQLAAAKTRMAQIEREFALRGVHGDELAGVIQGAKEQRLEREAMQQEESLGLHTGEDLAPDAAPVAAGTASAPGLAPVEGTGATQTRGLAANVERKALVNKLNAGIGDLPEYRAINMEEQAAHAAELLARDPALARRIALGELPAPDHLLPESVFVAVENRAILDGDVATIRELATGKLTSEATTMGQRIRALGERDPDSPVAAIKKVVEVRTAGAKNVPKATEDIVTSIRAKLDAAKLTPAQWAEFVNSLRC